VSWPEEQDQEGNGQPPAGANGEAAADGVPAWLAALAEAAQRMTVPELRQPPEHGGRAAAVLVLFGEGQSGPD
jgi:hypothetical protein